MMFAQRVRPDDLIDLLVAESYDPVIMKYCGYTRNAPKLCEFITERPRLGVTGTIANSYVSAETQGAVPYLTTKQVSGLFARLEGCKYITQQADQEWAHCRVPDGAIVLNKSGNVGAAAIVACSPMPYVNTVSDLINVRPRVINGGLPGRTIDPGYLVVFLNDPYGQSQLRRLSGGAVFDHVSLHAIPEVRIFEPALAAQQYIGDKVRQAEKLRVRARRIDAVALGLLNQSFEGSLTEWVLKSGIEGVLPSGGFQTRVRGPDLRGRLDPAGYHPELRAIVRRATASPGVFRPLSQLADIVTDQRERVSSVMQTGAYVSVLHLDECGFVDMHAAARHQPDSDGRQCYPGDVLLSGINPAANRVGVCGDFAGVGACSPEFSILSAKGTLDPHYLAFVLRSFVVLRQLIHLGHGTSSSRRRVDESELATLQIPLVEHSQHIGRIMAIRQACIAASNALISASRLLVESLIEGSIQELELVSAQRALEGGDRRCDRALLRALRYREDGYSTPVFPDLDAFYALLDDEDQDGGGV